MILFLGCLCIIFCLALIIVIRQCIRLGRIIIDVEDAIPEALDACDVAYDRVSRLLEMPVALATPEVKQVMNELKNVRNMILSISNVLAGPLDGIIDDDDNDAEEK
jgi:hypothetical protein